MKRLGRSGWFVDLLFNICLPLSLPLGGLGIEHVNIYSQLRLFLMACAIE
jgi:hypothetical protein